MSRFPIFQPLEIEYSVLCERLLGTGINRKEGTRYNTVRDTSGERLNRSLFAFMILPIALVLDTPRVCR